MPETLAPEAARWYHTIELPDGSVTPGEYDLRTARSRVPLPETLAGKRCLDVGTRDGFWAFEMERRGAAEVVAIDLDDERDMDWPQPRPPRVEEEAPELERRASAFGIAHELLDSKVDRRDQSVYELTTEKVGEFDFAVIGTLLLHLRDPIGALTAIGRVLRGQLLVNDVISLGLTLRRPRTPSAELHADHGLPFWWTPNLAGLKRQVEAAGFEIKASGGPYLVKNGPGLEPLRLAEGPASQLPRRLVLRRGMPHAWVLAEPRKPAL